MRPALPPFERRLTTAEITRLLAKYEELRRLRVIHHAACTTGAAEPDPRPALARLAEEFPGALREIDRLPLATIEARITALRDVLGAPDELDARGTPDELGVRESPGSRAALPWMHAQVTFHRVARAALAAKRCLAGAKAVTPDHRAAIGAAVLDAALVADDLDAIAAPPNGRLMAVVHARVARILGLDVAASRALVFDDG